MNSSGVLVVFSGPSGSGKGTVLAQYFAAHPEAAFSVSATTRAPRPGEVDGVNYHFVSRERFEEMISQGEVLEYTQYGGNYYGSPAGPIREALEQGRDVVLEIEVEGAMQVRERFPEAPLLPGAGAAPHQPGHRDPGADRGTAGRRPAGAGPGPPVRLPFGKQPGGAGRPAAGGDHRRGQVRPRPEPGAFGTLFGLKNRLPKRIVSKENKRPVFPQGGKGQYAKKGD